MSAMKTEEQLVGEHAGAIVAYALSLGWYIPGSDRDDVAQEALIGLLSAARSYREGAGLDFLPFARFCVRRHLIEKVRLARAQKHGPLTLSMREGKDDEHELVDVVGLLPARTGIEQLLEAREQLRALIAGAEQLSELERRAVFGTAAGYSCAELATRPSTSVDRHGTPRYREVDNATQRARAKLRPAA